MLHPCARMVSRVVVGLIGLAGCAGGDGHPAPTGGISSPAVGTEADRDDAEEAAARLRADACKPQATRECVAYWVDSNGTLNCPKSVEFCRASGNGWLPCGAPFDGE